MARECPFQKPGGTDLALFLATVSKFFPIIARLGCARVRRHFQLFLLVLPCPFFTATSGSFTFLTLFQL
jgi:hypothetical protein